MPTMPEDPTTDEPGLPAPATSEGEGEGEVRVGFCAILGLPNVGKSTLLNRVLGIRLVAVSRKPQTTRNRILGVFNTTVPARPAGDDGEPEAGESTGGEPERRTEPAQIIFMDTPGMQKGSGALRKYMRDQALGAAGDADLALLVIDAGDPTQHDPRRLRDSDAAALRKALLMGKAPVILVINKIDCLPSKQEILPIIAAYSQIVGADGDSEADSHEGAGADGHPDHEGNGHEDASVKITVKIDDKRARELEFAAIIPISAHTGEGIAELVAAIGQRLPLGPRLFPEDMVTDRAERFLAGELIREQLFRQLGQELPYATAVVVESFRERADHQDVVIDATIYVERDSQKGIVVGKGGRRIKEVGQHAREAISQLLGCPAHVKLYVKVATNWSRIERGIRQMGYE